MVLTQRLNVQGQGCGPREIGILEKEKSWNLGIGIKKGALTEPMVGVGGLSVV